MSAGQLAGRIALITGAAGMIGAATARELAARGALLVAVDRPGADWALLDTTATRIEADVRDEAEVAGYAAEAVKRHGRIDIFFNNAGIEGPQATIADYSAEDFRRVLDINVTGVFLGLKAVMPVMQAQGGGAIINTSSIAGIVGAPAMAGYITSKHAVLGLTKVAALEGAPHGVRVNAVHPGFIDSRMLGDIVDRLGAPMAAFVDAVPAKRLGTVEEVAKAVAFLASDDASYMNGSSLVLDGGVVIA